MSHIRDRKDETMNMYTLVVNNETPIFIQISGITYRCNNDCGVIVFQCVGYTRALKGDGELVHNIYCSIINRMVSTTQTQAAAIIDIRDIVPAEIKME